ncbi:MAG: BON domain-containing protein [Deltaproteobacteria bacterium]|nr:BON domain-containing protein [Deltaproteobacteria bacterium]
MIVLRSDEALAEEVRRELAWDSQVNAVSVHVAVANRIVALTGTVRSYAEKVAAQRAAHRVPGVLDVVNDVTVLARADERSDAEIAAAVRHALQWDVRVPDERITSTVSGGSVTLGGTVELLREREDAEEAVRALRGVRNVVNDLVVAPRRIDSRKVRSAIEDALARQAHHDTRRIAVAVENGVVTLSGPVDSFAEKRAVMGVVGHLPGVVAVCDRLMLPA